MQALLNWTNGHYGINNDRIDPNGNFVSLNSILFYPAIAFYQKANLKSVYRIHLLYDVPDRYGNGVNKCFIKNNL